MVATMQSFMDQEAEHVYTEPQSEIVLANPNPFLVYEDTIGGKVMKFAPLKKYALRALLGQMLVDRAADYRRNAEANAQSERQHWAQCISSMSQVKKDMAMKFCEPVKGADGAEEWIPKTRVLPFPGLVRADSADGQGFIKRGLDFMESTEGADLDHYLEHYKRYVWDPEAEKEKKANPQATTESALKEAEEAVKPMLDFILELPNTKMELEQKVGYIERLGDKKVPKGSLEDHAWLDAKMQEVYETFKSKLDKAKVKYKEV